MLDNIKISHRQIGPKHKPFIIAEMSGNHNQSLERALKIVEAAAQAGADAVKLQTYTADTMTIDHKEGAFTITDPNSLWHGRSLYELYQEAYTPWEWHAPIMQRAKECGILCFSTPFDETAVDFLEELNVPAYKVASFENTDIHLIKKVAATGKPIIISTGMATLSELQLIVNTLKEAKCENFVLLKCTSAYPAPAELCNINMIPHMRQMLHCQIGLSDHTMGIGVPVASVALGATVIEKHFTLSRAEGGVDAAFSIEPQELKLLVEETERAWRSLGQVRYNLSEQEKKSLQFRRSIYFVKNVQQGDKITADAVRIIRPGDGLAPQYLDDVLNKQAKQDIARGTPVDWELLV